MKYRLGLDVGTNSLGWAAIMLKGENAAALSPGPLLDMGVRIFSDARHPKDKSSNAAQRRGPRSARRNRDRMLARRRNMLTALIEAGLFPETQKDQKTLEQMDPWILRARALDEKLNAHEVGRALFHLQQRRGFKSNRKTDGAEKGAMYDAIASAREKMEAAGAPTLGALFGRPRMIQAQAN
ncbi:MAG: type II CRISPR RNA-guided endonuclease Cas9, partial [Pseudomonadota bacterium]